MLACIDGCGAIAEIVTTPESNLDEHQFVSVRHDEIDFTEARAEVARDWAQAPANQITFGCFLCAPA